MFQFWYGVSWWNTSSGASGCCQPWRGACSLTVHHCSCSFSVCLVWFIAVIAVFLIAAGEKGCGTRSRFLGCCCCIYGLCRWGCVGSCHLGLRVWSAKWQYRRVSGTSLGYQGAAFPSLIVAPPPIVRLFSNFQVAAVSRRNMTLSQCPFVDFEKISPKGNSSLCQFQLVSSPRHCSDKMLGRTRFISRSRSHRRSRCHFVQVFGRNRCRGSAILIDDTSQQPTAIAVNQTVWY